MAQIHEMEPKHVRELVKRNKSRFKENIDIKGFSASSVGTTTEKTLSSLGYTRVALAKADTIYILSERGYSKLIKIMDTDLAWDIHDALIDQYFTL